MLTINFLLILLMYYAYFFELLDQVMLIVFPQKKLMGMV